MRVTIGVHGRYHAFDLAARLHARGTLAQVATTYPRFAARRFLPGDVCLRTIPTLELVRRVNGRLRLAASADAYIARAFGRFAARCLPADADVFVGWSSASIEAIRTAKARGMLTVVERGSTHIRHQEDVLTTAYARHGLRFAGIDPELVAREIAEYDAADRIAVPTAHVADTFVAHGIGRARLIVNPYGVAPAPETHRQPVARPTILFVGGVGVRKGAPELAEAFATLRGQARLVFAGPVEPGWRAPDDPGITYLGAVGRDRLATLYAEADVFCLPSHEEGLSLSLLQAMASGLPVVATAESGAAEVMTDGVEGLIVPPGDFRALGAALARLADGAGLRREMGAAARARAGDLSWDAYGDRAIAAYRAALATR